MALAELLVALNADPGVNGVLLQLPLPAHLDGEAMAALIDPAKDVDGLTPLQRRAPGPRAPGPGAVHARPG